MKYVIIGGVAAGASAATQIRRYDRDSEIIIYERDQHLSYSACGMPYFLGGVAENFTDIVSRDDESFKKNQNIDVYFGHEVRAINPENKTIQVRKLNEDVDFEDTYDKLLIATGASATIPGIEGADSDHVFALRTVEHMIEIENYIQDQGVQRVAIIGSGSIGLEIAENFITRGLEVVIVNRSERIGSGYVPAIKDIIHKHVAEKGVKILVGAETQEIFDDHLLLKDGRTVPMDMLIVATGVRPNVEIAEEAGVQLGETGAIQVNQFLETNIEDIYAAGDCCEQKHVVSGENVYIPLGSTSNKQGFFAGLNMAGEKEAYAGTSGTSIVKVFDLSVGKVGLSKKEAEDLGYEPIISQENKQARVGYFSDSKIYMEIMADKKSGKILGAQLIGKEDVDKRTDVLASILYYGGVVDDLLRIDLSYAPPFNRVRDILFYAGLQLKSDLKKEDE